MRSPEKEQWKNANRQLNKDKHEEEPIVTEREDAEEVSEGNSRFFWGVIAVGVILVIALVAVIATHLHRNTEPAWIEVSYEQPEITGDGVAMMEQIDAIIAKQQAKENQKRFENALFVGDSLTEGLGLYGYVKTKNLVAQKGLSIEQAMKKMKTIVKKNPETIYIMLGINDLNYSVYTLDDIEGNYRKLVKKLHKNLPDSKIYVESLLPVTKAFAKEHKNLSNQRINKLNKRLKALSDEYDYTTYVDIHQLYVNKNGDLPKKISSDGYHLKLDAYSDWVDYLKNGTGK
jgi:lysophospholipase L1-like esterase